MTKKVFCLKPSNTIEDAMKLFRKKDISGAPIVNEENKLVGIITETDLLKYLGSDDLLLLTPEKVKELRKMIKEKLEKVMKKKVITAKPDEDIKDIVAKMNKNRINRVVIVDDENRVVGIVTREDIIKAISLEAAKKEVKKRIEKEKIEIARKEKVTINDLLNLVKEKGKVKLEEAVKALGLPEDIVEEWAKILDEHGLIKLKYPLFGKPILMRR